MEKGFGLIIFIVVLALLLVVGGGGFWLGRMSVERSADPGITAVSNNQNQSTADAPQTNFMKRNFDPNLEIFPGHPLPQELTAVSEANLAGFNCDGPYLQQSDGRYLWSVELDGEQYFKPLTGEVINQIVNINNFLTAAGNQQPAAYLTYCVTESGGKYLLAGQPLPGGGAGSDTYIMDLNHGANGPLSGVVKSEPWPYFGCSSILQITQDVMYIFCSGGDGGFSGQAIYKKSLTSASVTPVIKCTNELLEDRESSEINCE